jgi:phosphate transport system substrate-binding protein
MGLRGTTWLCLALAAASLVAGCGGGGREERSDDVETGPAATSDLSGRVEADGSSTVGPFTTAAAERFQRASPDVRITVGVSGTGGGFERFCRDETDVSNASRPIKEEEEELCAENGVSSFPIQVANDGISIVVNKDNTWATCLTVDQLKKIWEPGSKVDNWNEVRPAFPDAELVLAGPGTDSGTFDYFTDAIVGEEGASRSDYTASENDNVTVQAVGGEKGGLGYFGFSYLEENLGKVKAVAVDGGDGCVEPSVETAQDGTYKPLSRPLFVYVKNESLERQEVEAFVHYILDNETEIAEAARFVPLTDEQLSKARDSLEQALAGS